ncbi:hypothetical protein CFP65_3924 [Kitasatospora sp. MMS16-BH015]|uniref:DUF6153 family protein n=1 Tax=Kitasatospora sp. MMS16-BH015 TaxID=2018025 RepID=UPI000CA2C0A9|nr:DUF6153 family protein [Kitasatospora sp. MMS16-BH015]AUG78697.1 hypothetical protein CFP65_3924 [Kitasatospora sp. MMS16-BH015]
MARERRALTRLYVLCAVLAGLFLMHGSPASAASGCHRTSAETVRSMPHHAMVADRSTEGPEAAPGEGGHGHAGEVCLATPGRDGQPVATPGPAPITVPAALPALGGGAVVDGAEGSRAPPEDLLLKVCVART